MKAITLLQPQKIVFGTGCIETFTEDYKKMGLQRLMVLTAPPILPLIEEPLANLKAAGVSIEIFQNIVAEPTVNDFKKVLAIAQAFHADSVVGIGGGSVLDLTKLIASLTPDPSPIGEGSDMFQPGFIKKRGLWFACLPTTAGTGSEVSPNAILLDERDHLKKGIVWYGCTDTLYRSLHQQVRTSLCRYLRPARHSSDCCQSGACREGWQGCGGTRGTGLWLTVWRTVFRPCEYGRSPCAELPTRWRVPHSPRSVECHPASQCFEVQYACQYQAARRCSDCLRV